MTNELGLEPTVEINSRLATEVTIQLREYFALQAAIKALEADAEKIKTEVARAFESEGESGALELGVKIEGEGSLKMVRPTVAGKLDPVKLLRQGVTQEQIVRATGVDKPGKAYLKLTPAKGEK